MTIQPWLSDEAESIDNPFWRVVSPFVRTEGKYPFMWGGPQVMQFTFEEPPGMRIGGPGWSEWYRIQVDKMPKRHDLVQEYSWAVPAPSTLRRLAAMELGPVVELGAGTGYWAYCLEQLGMDFVCYDENPPGDTRGEPNHWHPGTHQWTPVLRAGIEALALHPDRALMLCWPPYSEPMAYDALTAYQGDTLIYIGEDAGGCCADDKFFELLGRDWDLDGEERPPREWKHVDSIGVIQWEGMHDTCEVYRRA